MMQEHIIQQCSTIQKQCSTIQKGILKTSCLVYTSKHTNRKTYSCLL